MKKEKEWKRRMKNKDLQRHLDVLDDITGQILEYAYDELEVSSDERAAFIDNVNKMKKQTKENIKFCKKHYFIANCCKYLGPISSIASVIEGINFGRTLNNKHLLWSYILFSIGLFANVNIGYEDSLAIIVEDDTENNVNDIVDSTREIFSGIKWAKEPDS